VLQREQRAVQLAAVFGAVTVDGRADAPRPA
jgi:hypothetical protein